MTKRELADLLGYSFTMINNAFTAAEKRNPTILKKKGSYNKNLSIDYSLEECLDALREYSPMEQQIVKEHFIHRDEFYKDSRKDKLKIPKDIKDFIFLYQNCNDKYAVCNTCAYLVPKKIQKVGSRYHPYCTFYECFLNKQKNKLNVYKDRCPSYQHDENKIPFLWLKEGPVNLNVFLQSEQKILDRDASEYTSKKTKNGEPISLLKDEEIEYDIFE